MVFIERLSNSYSPVSIPRSVEVINNFLLRTSRPDIPNQGIVVAFLNQVLCCITLVFNQSFVRCGLSVVQTGGRLKSVSFKLSQTSTHHRDIVFVPVIGKEGLVDLVFYFTFMFKEIFLDLGSLIEQKDVVMVVGHETFIILRVPPLLNRWPIFFSMDILRINAIVLEIRLTEIALK